MNSQKAKKLKKAVHDWCNEQGLPAHMWNRAWKRFKKLYSSNEKLRKDMDEDPIGTLNNKFVAKRKSDDKKSDSEKYSEA